MLAPPYLLILVLLRDRFPDGPAFPAAALAGILLFLPVLGRNLLKRRTGSPWPASSMEREGAVREAIAHGRSIVRPREEIPAETPTPDRKAAEESTLLRGEADLRDGIRRSLETVLPLTGASHAAYLAPSNSPGRTGHEGVLVTLGGEGTGEFSVPDTYVPVREATVFRRPFLEEGECAARYSPWAAAVAIRPTGVAAVPVLCEGTPEGVLLVIREEGGRWNGPVIPLMELVAFFIGREIGRARAQHRGERRFLREDWYYRMVRKMAQMSPPRAGEGEEDLRTRRERVYAEAADQARLQSRASRVLLVASADGGRKGRLVREETASGGRTEENSIPLADTYVGWVIRTGSQRLFSESQGLPRSHEVLPERWRFPGERSFIVLPAEAPGGFRGAVVCTHPEERRFHRGDADQVRDIVEVMQLGLSHVEHLETLTRKATTDGLTGLSNRKAFLAHLSGELSRLDGRHPCAVVMLDIDHFKRVNDTYGHPFGDEVLRRVAGILGKAVRKGDAAGRYGGEEFVLYLHMTAPEQAQEVAERFRRMVRQARFLHEGREITVTASLGVACSPSHGRDPGELMKRADEALYLSKNRGRDRVTLYPG